MKSELLKIKLEEGARGERQQSTLALHTSLVLGCVVFPRGNKPVVSGHRH